MWEGSHLEAIIFIGQSMITPYQFLVIDALKLSNFYCQHTLDIKSDKGCTYWLSTVGIKMNLYRKQNGIHTIVIFSFR